MSTEDLIQIDDLPKGGPLEKYREAASFDWKKMKLFFESIDLHKYKVRIRSFSFLRFKKCKN
jgi:hypothetical protein